MECLFIVKKIYLTYEQNQKYTKILNQVDPIYILKLQVKYYYVTCIY